MNKTKVTVIVPTYNHEKYISQCLESILTQKTNFDFKILIGEDESSDNTRNICLEYQEKYPNKIEVILQSRKNVIKINNRITGRYNFIDLIKRITTPYWAICEGDDYWIDENKLQEQVTFLEKNYDFTICYTETKIFQETTQQLSSDFITTPVAEETTINDILTHNYIHTPSVMYRNIFNIKKIPITLLKQTPVADYPLHLFHAENGKIKRISKPMTVYRIHDQGVWSQNYQAKKNWEFITQKILLRDYFSNNKLIYNTLNQQLIHHLKNIGVTQKITSSSNISFSDFNALMYLTLTHPSETILKKIKTKVLIKSIFNKITDKFQIFNDKK